VGRVAEAGADSYLRSARLNEGGEYLVEVARRASYSEPPVIGHVLTLSPTGQ